MAEPAQQKIYVYEPYQLPDGWYSFRVNGQESRYRSASLDGLKRTIHDLQHGPQGKRAAVRLPALKGAAGETGAAELIRRLVTLGAAQMQLSAEHMAAVESTLAKTPVPDVGPRWHEYPTEAERVAAFLRRGKLGQKE